MPYFKAKDGSVHCLDEGIDPATIPNFPQDAVAISDEEAAALQPKPELVDSTALHNEVDTHFTPEQAAILKRFIK